MTEYTSIKDEVLRKLQENLPDIQRRFGILELRLFGSVSRGDDTKSSDVDILYVFREGEATYDNLFSLHEYLTDLFGRRVELVSEKWSGERFLKSALKDAVSIISPYDLIENDGFCNSQHA